MNKKSIAAIFFGIILALLGLLWFLQGSDLVHIKPILCFANCEPVTGRSFQWQIVGSVVFVIGAYFTFMGLKRSVKIKKA